MQGPGVARRALQGTFDRGRRREPVGVGADTDRWGAVLALLARELARPWRKQRRRRGPTLTNPAGAVLQPASEESGWKP